MSLACAGDPLGIACATAMSASADGALFDAPTPAARRIRATSAIGAWLHSTAACTARAYSAELARGTSTGTAAAAGANSGPIGVAALAGTADRAPNAASAIVMSPAALTAPGAAAE